jgi:hypothetical protein
MTATALTPAASQKYNKGKYVPGNLNNLRVVSNYYDASAETTIDAGDGDYVNLLVIPANSIIVGFGFNVLTAESTNGTVDVGISGVDTDCFFDALNIATTGSKLPNGGTSFGYYTGSTAKTIIVTATTDGADVDIDGAKFEAWCVYVKLDAQKSVN